MNRVLPIMFNTEMVRAILSGRKIVTRRLMKFPVNKFTGKLPDADSVKVYKNTLHSDKVCFDEAPFYCFSIKPLYRPGDILYVRETWNYGYIETSDIPESCERWFEPAYSDCGEYIKALSRYFYKADENVPGVDMGMFWRPSIHMPKEAARIWLKVTDVRVERLHDMDYRDALYEGVNTQFARDKTGGYVFDENPLDEFIDLWDSTIKKPDLDRYGWDANPWVWVIDFERCEKPNNYFLGEKQNAICN